MRRPRLGIVISSLVAAVFAGCGTSPEPRFYTLSAGENPARDRNEKAVAEYSIAVGPVTLPEMVDRPELVIRIGTNQVSLVEQHRWAEPLRTEVARVVAETLGKLLGGSQVMTYSNNASREADYRVLLDIQRFDSTLGQGVMIDALWAIRRSSSGEPITGRSVVREATGGNGYDALVATHVRALATVSGEIAEAIRIATTRQK